MTTNFASIDKALDFAIQNEIEANQFYRDLAAKMDRPAMRQVFEEFAKEEQGHRAKLEAVKRGEYKMDPGQTKVQDLQIGDYLVDVEPKPDMSYADALVLAMKQEKAAYKLYLDLASASGSAELAGLFLSLAAEEAKHKLRFEIEYDDEVLKEN